MKHNEWVTQLVTLPAEWRRFVLEGIRGGASYDQDQGDIAIDDIWILVGRCRGTACINPIQLHVFEVKYTAAIRRCRPREILTRWAAPRSRICTAICRRTCRPAASASAWNR